MRKKLIILMLFILIFTSACAKDNQKEESSANNNETTGAEKSAENDKTESKDESKEESTDESKSEQKIETKEQNLKLGEKFTGKVTINLDMSKYEKGKIVKVWVPYPISDEKQTITNYAIDGNYSKQELTKEEKYGNNILYAEWDAEAAERNLTLSFNVERSEILRPDLSVSEIEFNKNDFAKYLEASSMVVVDGEVKTLADEITKDKATVVEKAKAIYDWTVENMYRNPDTIGCGKGDVCALLSTPGGKCTDISSVFVALCRAAEVPAREVFSVRMGKEDGQDITKWQHCWAEFYLPGTGWVSVDPADVRKKMLKEDLELDAAEIVKARDYWWGNIDSNRLVIAAGRDIDLVPKQEGQALNTFGYPYAEVDGEVIDFYTPAEFVYTITYNK